MTVMPSSPYILFTHSLHFTPTFTSSSNFISYHDIIIFNHALLQVSRRPCTRCLHSFHSLFCSSPVCSRLLTPAKPLADERCRPSRESQQQARSAIGVFNAGKDDLTGLSNISAIVNSLHPLETFKSVGARDTVDLDERGAFGGLGRLLNGFGSNGFLKALGGGASGIATTVAGDLSNKALNSTR
jgi:hypothetical protein